MAAESASPKNSPRNSVVAAGLPPESQSQNQSQSQGQSDCLFYAYARRSDYAQFSPYLLTFVNVDIARQWWELVQKEYPDSTREGTQLFTFKGDDIPGQIWDNRKFEQLKNKWFYSHFGEGMSGTGGVIPLQDDKGNLIGGNHAPSTATTTTAASPSPSSSSNSPNGHADDSPTPAKPSFDFAALQAHMEQMHAMIEQNSTQIRALGVAQSDGLQRMQDINETNASQIKALADGQQALQAMVDKNASQFIALTNAQFQNQDAIKTVLQHNANHVKTLADGQAQLADACKDMMQAVSQLSHTFGQTISSPGPRKLNKRVIAYTYQNGSSATLVNGASSPAAAPPA